MPDDDAELWLPSHDLMLLLPLDCNLHKLLLLLLLACLASKRLELSLAYPDMTTASSMLLEEMRCPSPCTVAITSYPSYLLTCPELPQLPLCCHNELPMTPTYLELPQSLHSGHNELPLVLPYLEMPQLPTLCRHNEPLLMLTYLELPQQLHGCHDELPLVLPRCPEMPQLPQSRGRHNELPLVLPDRELPQPAPGHDELLDVLHSLAEGGLLNSLAWGGVAARISQGERDLATLYSPARRGVAKLISWAEGGRTTRRSSLGPRRGVAAMISRAGGDMATWRPRHSLGQQRGVAALDSRAEGDKATQSLLVRRGVASHWPSPAWGHEDTHRYSRTEGGHLGTSYCSISMDPTLSLLRGRLGERREIDDLTTYTVPALLTCSADVQERHFLL